MYASSANHPGNFEEARFARRVRRVGQRFGARQRRHDHVFAAHAYLKSRFPELEGEPERYAAERYRADASGGFDKADVEQALGSPIDFEIVSDGRLVLSSNNDGTAFVTGSPDAPISQGVRRIADSLASHLRERSPALARQ